MTAKVRTCLWYDGNGEEAAEFYTSLIPGSEITHRLRPDPDGPALVVEFTLGGTPYMALNGGPNFPQSECVSIVVATETQAETDRLWNALIADGGAPSECGWLKDRFGVSWQITPEIVTRMILDPDREAAQRAMEAVWSMAKLDIATIEAAFRGEKTTEAKP